MPQEFLASFAVDIDESGVNRLQTILSRNRELAEQLAAAFDTARSSMTDFIRSATEELAALPFFSGPSSVEETLGASGTFFVDLDFTKASRQLEAFLTSAKKQFRLTADGSGIVSAASSALSQVRSMFAGAGLTLKVKTEIEKPGDNSRDDDSGSSADLVFTPVRAATGGRFSSPTHAEIAEDGDPEYVVPVKKENEAVPLIQSLLSELSAPALESLRDALAEPVPADRREPFSGATSAGPAKTESVAGSYAAASVFPDPAPIRVPSDSMSVNPTKVNLDMSHPAAGTYDSFDSADLFSGLTELLSSAPAAAMPAVNQTTSSNVSAPVNIHVEAASADPEAVGHSIYNTAERYLLRTIEGVVG